MNSCSTNEIPTCTILNPEFYIAGGVRKKDENSDSIIVTFYPTIHGRIFEMTMPSEKAQRFMTAREYSMSDIHRILDYNANSF